MEKKFTFIMNKLDDEELLTHEYFHIIQQRGGTNNHQSDRINESVAEKEVEMQIKKFKQNQKVHLSKTTANKLNKDESKHENNSDEFDFESDNPNVGTGRCAIFYVEMDKGTNAKEIEDDNNTFRRVAKRFVKNRKGRCFGITKSGDVKVNKATMFKTGKDIIEGIEKIASEEGKIAELYIISHGYSDGIVDSNMTSNGLLSNCEKHNSRSCRDVKSIESIAKKSFTKNIKVVLHACDVSIEAPYNIKNNGWSFGKTLYNGLAKALESEDVDVYGHNDNTKAGYNCSWVRHSIKNPNGEPKDLIRYEEENGKKKVKHVEENKLFMMPSELQLGNHEDC